jgi:hypothetical protein
MYNNPRQMTDSGRINAMLAPCLRTNDLWDATVSVVQGSINITGGGHAGIFVAGPGAFMAKGPSRAEAAASERKNPGPAIGLGFSTMAY